MIRNKNIMQNKRLYQEWEEDIYKMSSESGSNGDTRRAGEVLPVPLLGQSSSPFLLSSSSKFHTTSSFSV